VCCAVLCCAVLCCAVLLFREPQPVCVHSELVRWVGGRCLLLVTHDAFTKRAQGDSLTRLSYTTAHSTTITTTTLAVQHAKALEAAPAHVQQQQGGAWLVEPRTQRGICSSAARLCMVLVQHRPVPARTTEPAQPQCPGQGMHAGGCVRDNKRTTSDEGMKFMQWCPGKLSAGPSQQ
jgi:hypothetical protein